MQENEFSTDLKYDVLIQDTRGTLQYKKNESPVCRIGLSTTVIVPPDHEMVVEGKPKLFQRSITKSGTYLFEPKSCFGKVKG